MPPLDSPADIRRYLQQLLAGAEDALADEQMSIGDALARTRNVAALVLLMVDTMAASPALTPDAATTV